MGKFVKWSMHWKLKLLVFPISIDAKDEHKFLRFSVGRLLGCGLYLVWSLKKVFFFFLHFLAFFGLLSQALKAFTDQNFHYNVVFFLWKSNRFFFLFPHCSPGGHLVLFHTLFLYETYNDQWAPGTPLRFDSSRERSFSDSWRRIYENWSRIESRGVPRGQRKQR